MSTHPHQGRRALLGGAIIVVLLVLATGIFLLDDIIARFRSSYTVVAVLREAPRLAPGSRVWVGGSNVGEVSTVALMPAGGDTAPRVALALRLPGRVRSQVRRDSRVRVTALNLMGAPVIDITPGTRATPPLAPGDTLRQERAFDRKEVMARARVLRASLDTALAELQPLAAPLERRLAAVERMQGQLARAQAEYGRLMEDVAASPLFAAWQSGELQASLAGSRRNVVELLSALREAQLRAQRSGLAGSVAGFTERARALQQSLAALQTDMQQRGGTLDRLARDSALVRALATARAELDSLMVEARRNPLRFVR